MSVARTRSRSDSPSPFRSDRNAASMTINPTFITSEGENANPRSWKDRCAPFTVVPSGLRTASRSSSMAA